MTITSLIENTTSCGLETEHGLSLYIQLDNEQNILFDMGQSDLFIKNASHLELSMADVDIAIISHGHYDHGGGLTHFLSHNTHAPVYIHQDAFLPHFSQREEGMTYIGLDPKLEHQPRLVKCGDVTTIHPHLTLFADTQGKMCYPHGNRLLFGPDEHTNDTFTHEQHLIIQEGNQTVLVAGCAHQGIVNIMQRCVEITGHAPTAVVAGLHLVKSGLNKADEETFIRCLATEMMRYKNTRYYTMHCTGEEQYMLLKSMMANQIAYLACGNQINLPAHHS